MSHIGSDPNRDAYADTFVEGVMRIEKNRMAVKRYSILKFNGYAKVGIAFGGGFVKTSPKCI